eukprot:s8_g59.t1
MIWDSKGPRSYNITVLAVQRKDVLEMTLTNGQTLFESYAACSILLFWERNAQDPEVHAEILKSAESNEPKDAQEHFGQLQLRCRAAGLKAQPPGGLEIPNPIMFFMQEAGSR